MILPQTAIPKVSHKTIPMAIMLVPVKEYHRPSLLNIAKTIAVIIISLLKL